jgi:Flp pilus assembly protein TadG
MMKKSFVNCWLRLMRGSESGQALIELAVVGSLLVLIALGMIEFSPVIRSSIEVSNAAKAGAQYAAQNGATASDSTGIQNAAAAAAPDLSGLTATSSYACVCSDGSSSTCQNTDCANSHIEESVTVNTQVNVTPMLELPGFSQSYTLNGKATEKCMQ